MAAEGIQRKLGWREGRQMHGQMHALASRMQAAWWAPQRGSARTAAMHAVPVREHGCTACAAAAGHPVLLHFMRCRVADAPASPANSSQKEYVGKASTKVHQATVAASMARALRQGRRARRAGNGML